MSDEISHLKARYCRSVLATATISSVEDARHLIFCLTSEPLTAKTSREVQIAERDALASILTLHEKIETRSAAAVIGEWKSASDAVLRWMQSAGSVETLMATTPLSDRCGAPVVGAAVAADDRLRIH